MAKRRGTQSFIVDYDGPFFTKDPVKTLDRNITDMMDALAALAEHEVQNRIYAAGSRMPYATGHTARHVRGRIVSVTGKRWRRWLRVSMDTQGMSRREAIRTQAAASSIEARFHPFRRTAGSIRRSRAILSANLAKGME